MLKKYLFHTRFSLLISFVIWFLALSTLLRLIFIAIEFKEVSLNILVLLGTVLTGFLFDIGTISFIILPATIYYLVFPNRWVGSILDRVLVYFFTILFSFILLFTFFAEFTFWSEFKTRFNFIAVDYLIYTHEVVANIKESYPLPFLIIAIFALVIFFVVVYRKLNVFKYTFTYRHPFRHRIIPFIITLFISSIFTLFITNDKAEWSTNRYNAEISKSGIYSFFSAFRNNRMDYPEFYSTIDNKLAFNIVRNKLVDSSTTLQSESLSIHRSISDSSAFSSANKNVVFVLVESLSASFMNEFGSDKNITPFLDSLAQQSLFFSNLYATGTRTVRGMEAMTLCIPPTPGQSIVKRPVNDNLFTVSNVFKSKGYTSNFFYGGDGYFDNMNAYFGSNGFTIFDRGRGSVLNDKINTIRNNINDKEVTFENAWGICDEDIFSKMLSVADTGFSRHVPFFNFVMTTSNHRPYTYPANTIDIPSGTGREGAVKYTDYSLKKMFEKAKLKPWFSNTIFIIIADHCASSAGRDEIDVANYHIPAMIINLPQNINHKVLKQCSQIDIFPTLFSQLHWNYESNFFGKNVLSDDFEERTLFGTYRKLALLKKDKLMVLSDQKKQAFYKWNSINNSLQLLPMDSSFLKETIAWYQTADYLFTNRLLK